MTNLSPIALKFVLIVLAIYAIFLAIDFGFGGFQTLDWQGITNFLNITDEARYGVQDSHFRFLSGVLAMMGLIMLVAVSNLKKYQQVLNLLFGLIFVGGVMRFTSGNFDVLFSTEILTAVFAETGLIIILYFWLAHEVKTA